jgi:hypothetical protein
MAAIIGDFAEPAFLDSSLVVGNGGRELPGFIGILKK